MFKKILKFSLISFIFINLLTASSISLAGKNINDEDLNFKKLEGSGVASKINLVVHLPDQEWPILLGNIIKLVLNITGSLALISFTVGGIMMLTAGGADDKLTKAKSIIFWSIGALAIIAVAYAIVTGVTQLNFLTPQDNGGAAAQNTPASEYNAPKL